MTRRRSSITALVPALFLVPVVAGIVVSVARLVQVRYPAYGWTMNVDSDAQAMALGVWPFQDPAHGYTANGYTPLFPLVVSVFDRVYLWSGWSVLVTIASSIGCAAVVACIAWRRPRDGGRPPRVLAAVEAAGIGALAWSLAFGLKENGLLDARNDQPAWLPSLVALALVPAAVRGRRGARPALALAASAAFWVKQPGIAAVAAVGLALLVAVVAGRMSLRSLLVLAASTAAINVLALGLLGIATDGWQLRWNFGIHLPAVHSYWHGVHALAPQVAPAVLFAAAMGGLALRGRASRPLEWLAKSDDGLLATALIAFTLLGAFEGVYLMRFVAGDVNDALPFVWGLAGLGALGYRRAGDRSASRVAAAAVCVGLALTTLAGAGSWRVRRGDIVPAATYPALPDTLTSYAKRHLVYHPALPLSFLRGRSGVYPTAVHVREVLNRGRTPAFLVRALIERRFDGVVGLFAPDGTDAVPASLTQGEQDFYWKLNNVIEANYRLPKRPLTVPAGHDHFLSASSLAMRVPRATPPALYLARCFGPFHFGALMLRIHQGGGFWCRQPGGSITLLRTRQPASQLESIGSVKRVSGQMRVGVERHAGWWSVRHGDWELRAAVSPGGGSRLTLTRDGAAPRAVRITPDQMHRSHGVVTLAFARGSTASLTRAAGDSPVAVRIPADQSAKLEIWSSARLGIVLNLRALRVEPS